MQLFEQQQMLLRHRFGVCANEICDTCAKILDWLRFTRKDEPGEWCSRECRDGAKAAERYNATRKVGRPRQHLTAADRQRAYRERRDRVQQAVQQSETVTLPA